MAPVDLSSDEVIGRGFATHRLSGAPFPDPVAAVSTALCVQAQDPPLARYSLGLRLPPGDDSTVRAALDGGRIVRTHILRPTWHFVAADDLRWLLALTSPKVESSLAARHRQLEVDAALIDRVHDEVAAMLSGQRFLTAPEIGERLAAAGLPDRGAVVRHLLLVAELRGLVCSGPLRDSVHTYALVDERLPAAPALDRDDAARLLVRRFFAGHGPASARDLRRWTTLTLTEIRNAVTELGDALEVVRCAGLTLWCEPRREGVAEDGPNRRVALLPTFDEAYLPYREVDLARHAGHPRGDDPHVFAEAGGGVVVVDRQDAGWWKRTVQGSAMTIRLALASGLDADQRALVEGEAHALAAFFSCAGTVELVTAQTG